MQNWGIKGDGFRFRVQGRRDADSKYKTQIVDESRRDHIYIEVPNPTSSKSLTHSKKNLSENRGNRKLRQLMKNGALLTMRARKATPSMIHTRDQDPIHPRAMVMKPMILQTSTITSRAIIRTVIQFPKKSP
ncbi:hypothetical protein M408DRAFT_334365 [Serendipita vermifera MAFF 305830]|uniref:Uncharacterized protein n=1 Tax=Serendipita vermifera MAFF 305830 TaxID=933852 RepID=A0A0C2VYZ6_SERVB|nr:hypothetical protein M408DRAFT_334365 [Serendipita vermifera MAFF 305830]